MSIAARPLADVLAAASDTQLEQLLRKRGVRPDASWDDFFDAAEALLDPTSVLRGLAELTLTQARALRAAGLDEPVEIGAAGLGLIDAEKRLLPPVHEIVKTLPAPSERDGAPAPPASPSAAARAAERAFATVRGLADLLLAARTAPLALVGTGALSATEKRRLDIDHLDELRQIAECADLVRRVERELQVTSAGDSWLEASFPARWQGVAIPVHDALPSSIRDVHAADWTSERPWDPLWPDRADQLRRLTRQLGLLADDDTVPSWAMPIGPDPLEFDSSSLEALLPSEVDRIFLQNDLTAIAPGPLRPSLDNRLRAMSEHDSAQASSYRFTADSISRALADGSDGEDLLRFLREISLTGVPQPLEYLVTQTAARHGLVRVSADPSGSTLVTSSDPHLMEAMEVDRALRPLGLIRESGRLLSRVGPEAVAAALVDARYPASLVDAGGAAVTARRSRPAGAPAGNGYTELIARLRAHQGSDADAAWRDRELEAAVRAKAVVLVEVAMPDGSRRELELEAAGVGGGRLRGRDRAADVERTLPVRSIVSVRVLPG